MTAGQCLWDSFKHIHGGYMGQAQAMGGSCTMWSLFLNSYSLLFGFLNVSVWLG